MGKAGRLAVLLATLGGAPAAHGHSFGQVYTLPVPFWLYAGAASATLILSFLVVAWFATAAPEGATQGTERRSHRLPTWLVRVLQGLSLAGLGLCILTGLLGTPNPYGNFNMTFFWVLFVLGFAYLSALLGDLYALINPWRLLAQGLARLDRRFQAGWLRETCEPGVWPALLLYMGFISFELFAGAGPRGLALALCAYSLLTLAGCWCFGLERWMRSGEFFGVFLGLLARLAPVGFERTADGRPDARFHLRPPLAGALAFAPRDWGTLVFILFMLSSTAFDGLHETVLWYGLYWKELYPCCLVEWVGRNPLVAFAQLNEWYRLWQQAWLLFSPVIYLLLYLAAVTLVRRLDRRGESLQEVALRYAPSLLPIVLAYHFTHYYTLLQTQGIKILALASDPLGRGQDWFGTADWFRGAIVPDVERVWHVQVALIVLGHVAGVALVHREALRGGGSRRAALVAQLPMLLLMVAFTVAGLWILSLPLQGG